MSNRALAMFLFGTVLMFAVVWGGGYFLKYEWNRRSEAAAAEARASEKRTREEALRRQAAEKLQVQQRQQELAAKAEMEAEAKRKQTRAEEAVRQQQLEREAAAEAKRQRKLDLLTGQEKKLYDHFMSGLPRSSIKSVITEAGYSSADQRPLQFLVTNIDLFPPQIPVREKLLDFAKTAGGVNGGLTRLARLQGIEDADSLFKLACAFGMLSQSDAHNAPMIAESIGRDGLKGIPESFKLFIRQHPDLYPKWVP